MAERNMRNMVRRQSSFIKERPTTRDERYESLKSLGRLMECDLEAEMHTQRLNLPVIDVHSLSSSNPNARIKKPPSVMDYMNGIKSFRRKRIRRLLADINDYEQEGEDTTVREDTFTEENTNTTKAPKLKYDIVINTAARGTPTDSTAPGTPCNVDDTITEEVTGNDVKSSIMNLRERMAGYESMRNAQPEDDFQEFLGTRYLEMYRKRGKAGGIRRSNTCVGGMMMRERTYADNKQFTARSDNHLDVPNRSNLHKSSSQYGSDTNINYRSSYKELPPIDTNNHQNTTMLRVSTGHCRGDPSRGVVMPVINDMDYALTRTSARTGIPHHAAKRAHMRYFQSHGLSSILSGLKREPGAIKSQTDLNVLQPL